MKKHVSESQKYPRSSYIIIMPIAIILLLFLFATDIWLQLFLGLTLIILFLSLFYLMFAKFKIELSNDGILYSLTPFGKKQHIPKEAIKNIQITTFDFIGTFGGWGVRKRKGKKAYIFNDKSFLVVETSDTEYYFSIKNKIQFEELIQEYLDINVPNQAAAG